MELNGGDLQFLVDSKYQIQLDHCDLELICLSILNSATLVNRGLPKTDLFDRADEVYDLWKAIKQNRMAREMFPDK